MKGRELPSYIHRRKRDGVLLFRKREGGTIREVRLETQFPEGAAIPFALHQERETLLARKIKTPRGKTIASVLDRYESSDSFNDLAPRTRSDYLKHTEFFREKIGHLEPKSIKRYHVISWLDKWGAHSKHNANYRLRVLRIILERSIDYGLLPTGSNPASGVSELKYEKRERLPWPASLVNKAREVATGRTLLLFEMLLGTGQRIGDVLDMKWGDFDGEAVHVKQNKTKVKLLVPVPPTLCELLNSAERKSVFILTNHQATGKWSYRGASDAVMKLRKEIGAEAYDIHALRYTATATLASMGVRDEDIMAITGHKTSRMVELYSAGEQQRARARRAAAIRDGK